MLLVNPLVPPVPPDPPPVLLVCAFLHHISSSFTTPHHKIDPKAPMPWFLCASTSFSLKLLCSYAGMLSVQPLLMNPLLAEVALSSSLTTSQVSSFLQLIPVSKPRNLVSCVEHDSLKSPLRDLPYHQQEVVEILVASCYYFSATSWSAVLYCYIMLLLNDSLPRSEDVTNPLNFRFKFLLPQYEDAILYRTRLVYLAMVVHLTTINLLEEDGMPQESPHSTLSSEPSSLQILSDFIVPFFALRTWLDLIEIIVVVVYAMGAVPKLWSSRSILFCV
ncbi:unnamed protein product [Brassica oleracea]